MKQQETVKKTVFVIKPHSIVDVITNSSSELFVAINSNKETIEQLIEKIHPNYLDEYEELKTIDDLEPEELDIYFQYACSSWSATKKEDCPVLPGFTFDELYVKTEDASWPEIGYDLRSNDDYSFVIEENFEQIKNKLDPNREMLFLFSISDNPQWEFQEQFEEFMLRYHLG
jgi:hypothetical protein